MRDELAQRVGPGRGPTLFVEIKSKGFTDTHGRTSDVTRQLGGPDEGQRSDSRRTGKLAIPLLALLTDVNGVE